MTRTLITALLLVVGACAQQPPERTPLPDVEAVLPEPLGCQLSVGAPLGAAVSSVLEDSPAETTLAEGDVVVSVGGISIVDAEGLVGAVGSHRPGDAVEIVYERDGVRDSVSLTLGTNPSDPERPFLGVTIRTAYETVGPGETDDLVQPGPTTRPVEIAGRLYVFDPLHFTWQDTGLTIPEGLNWVSTTTGFYAATDDLPAVLFDLVTGEELTHDGFRGWEPRRIIGSLGDRIVVVVTTDIPDQPGFINIAIAGFDPTVGETLWVSPVLTGFGVPVAAHGSPDESLFVAVGTDQDTGEEIGVELYDTDGTLRNIGELAELGSPIGWFGEGAIAFRSDDDIVSVLDLSSGSTSTFTLPASLVELPLSAVGDGRHVLAVESRTLLLDDLTTEGEVRLLAEDCVLGRLGAPGWGL